MKKLLNYKITHTLLSILPIALIVIILGTTIVPVSGYKMTIFIISTIFLIIGMELFSRGADSAVLPMGEKIGNHLSKSRKLIYFIICSLLFGFIITLAEPDLLILAEQVININKWLFIFVVAVGFSIFMMIAVMRIIFQVKITTILFISYSIIIILMFFVPTNMLPIALDSGAVVSGPISVPFILALGTGISAVRASKNSKDDSFGLIALINIGPILMIMILSFFIDPNVVYTEISHKLTGNLFSDFGWPILENLYKIAITLTPITIIFFIFNFTTLKLPSKKINKIIIGIVYTFIGLTLFLTGVSVGYLEMAGIIGSTITIQYNWLIIPLSVLIGLVIIFAEPAVHVLNKKIEEITGGIITKRVMMIAMAIGVSISLLLAVFRAIYEINIFFIVLPFYILILSLLFFIPKIFVPIAFDSGSVASGSMSACFLLPFVIGISQALGNNIMASAFGTIALVSTTPILIIQILGLIYKIIRNRKKCKEYKLKTANVEILEFDVGVIL